MIRASDIALGAAFVATVGLVSTLQVAAAIAVKQQLDDNRGKRGNTR